MVCLFCPMHAMCAPSDTMSFLILCMVRFVQSCYVLCILQHVYVISYALFFLCILCSIHALYYAFYVLFMCMLCLLCPIYAEYETYLAKFIPLYSILYASIIHRHHILRTEHQLSTHICIYIACRCLFCNHKDNWKLSLLQV